MSEQPDETGFPTIDESEMKVRERFVLIEERVAVVFWLAIAAELGVLGLAAILCLHSWKDRRA